MKPFPFAIWPLEKASRRSSSYGLLAHKYYRTIPEESMEPGKMYGLYYPPRSGGPGSAIEIDSPEKLEAFRDHPDNRHLVGFFGKQGLLEFRGNMRNVSIADSLVPTSWGGTSLIEKFIKEPRNNLHIDSLRGGTDSRGNFGEERLDNPEVQRQLFDVLHKIGVKSITSTPLSESRRKLFARVTDKFHKESGGLED